MARRPRKRSRWPIALAESLLLPCLIAIAPRASAVDLGSSQGAADGTALALDPVGAMAAIDATDLYLDLTLNGTYRGLTHFGYRDGKLWASRATLQQLGFMLPVDSPDPIRLDSLPGVQVRYDAQQQTAALTVPLKLLQLPTSVLKPPGPPVPHASASPGALLNYNLYATHDTQGNATASAYTELRLFGGAGVLSSTGLTQANRADGDWRGRSVRLDTTWTSSFPEHMLTLQVGDTLTGGASWSRPTRIGGVQIGTDFALQPYRVTAPLPQFLGQATLPSQVELYIDGMKQYSGQVPVGPFQLNAVPGINGAGNAQLVLTDALGRVTTVDFSLYDTQQLLQKGLTDWSAGFGFVREDYGLRSFSYGHDPMASGSWRRGLTDQVTAGAHAELTQGLANAGVGGDWLLGTAGVLSGSAAHSSYHGLGGSQLSLGYQWINNRFNFSAQGTRSSSGYRDVAALYGSPSPRLSASAQAGISTRSLGNFGISYVHLRYLEQTSRYASGYWYRSLGRSASLSLNLNQNLDDARDHSVFLSFSLSLDDRTYMSAGLDHQGSRNMVDTSIARSLPTKGGFGWRAQTQQGEGTRSGLAELDYLGRYGQVQAGVMRFSGDSTAFAGGNGALVLMDGHAFAARSIYNGFAVVSTDGIPDVPVKLENNPIGHTDAHGLLLVTPLNAYQNNKLSIDPMQLPADVRVGQIDLQASPTDRAGTLVRFDLEPHRSASVLLRDAAGKPLPLGSEVRVRGQAGEAALVGFDGAAYLDTLGEHNVLEVSLPAGGRCSSRFDYRQQGEGIPQVGPLTCTKENAP
ncbi:fimbria/pilus outer membrane usher protein [Frateuria terrea]|uniref:Outer membrane usher protein n=1 Tax=Frateuria terrea TaxID=529704 RepID=A0A1H6S970_9GAMM|nr:fimbria/pilus outer membrane usher protein [Frateuria terrea]SEI64573.1 outer membrane usher protein [Frateuria terrea]SFP24695.1 outer membrane usher protein [Frateuria terrea]